MGREEMPPESDLFPVQDEPTTWFQYEAPGKSSLIKSVSLRLSGETLFAAEDGAFRGRLHQRHDGQEHRRRVFEIRALTERARQRRRDENVALFMRAFMSRV